jgi:hypothetical protein
MQYQSRCNRIARFVIGTRTDIYRKKNQYQQFAKFMEGEFYHREIVRKKKHKEEKRGITPENNPPVRINYYQLSESIKILPWSYT